MRNVLAMACGLAFLSSLGARAQDDGSLLLRSPTISKTQIVFNYAGDLWTVGRDRVVGANFSSGLVSQ